MHPARKLSRLLFRLLGGLCWLWRPEANPWRSLVAERGRRVAPHPQYENSYSQCLVAETVWIDALHTVLKVDE